ncbi:MAG: 16S rRNA (cytosine(1402)-N(4))-methyltransferase RsmH [Acidimicrobiaceae bacterium]|nr:16S rRNA (cytosine(1402)-N(4))-methyltransferase RsmH [Acidimicrobiaceae bacterium]
MLTYHHEPVMCSEVVDVLSKVPGGVFLDATIGGGGHSLALLESHPELQLVGIDRDPAALQAAAQRLHAFHRKTTLQHACFSKLEEILDELGCPRITAALFDLGVSSVHFDDAKRGFSYRLEGPLDMRMNPTTGITAAEIVNQSTTRTLKLILRENSDEPYAYRIANAIVKKRPFHTTTELAEVVKASVPAAVRRRGHPARRVFQALRIEVNSELRILAPALESVLKRLAPAGRCVVLSYHSGEDRIVKNVFRQAASAVVPQKSGLPLPVKVEPSVRLLWKKPRRPSEAEKNLNSRSSSAYLRGVERLDAKD